MAAVRIGLVSLCLLCSGRAAVAQVVIGAEFDRDRFTYHFDRPTFEQRYDADNVWLVGEARYTRVLPLETTAGLTPSRTSTGDDYDTFPDADGATIVSGTTGPVSIHSWRIGQRADVAHAGAFAFSAGYRLRVDIVDFGLGHKTVTRNGVLVSATDVTSPEHTSSQMHEIYGGVRVSGLAAELAPVTLGRLLVQLPDKYPGQDLIYYAKGATGSASYALTRAHVTVAVHAEHTWTYSPSAALRRTIVGVRAGYRW